MLVVGSYPDPGVEPVDNQLEHPQTHLQHPISEQGDGDDENNDKSASSQECLIPCPHIYDPVCGSTFGDNSAEEELREFPNECSMNRFNCEWNTRKHTITDHFIMSLALLDTGYWFRWFIPFCG